MLRETGPGWRREAGTGPGWRREAGMLVRARGWSRAGASFQGASRSREEAPGAGYCTKVDWREGGGGAGCHREVGGCPSCLYCWSRPGSD